MKNVITYLLLCFFALNYFSLKGENEKGKDDVVFIENKGQWHSNILYKLELTNGALFFEKNRVVWHMVEPAAIENTIGRDSHNHGNKNHETTTSFVFQSYFKGANLNTEQVANSPRNDYRNYFKGKDPNKWQSGVKLYKNLRYNNIYNNIDVEYYGQEDFLKYDWIVHPGADPSQIQTLYSQNLNLSIINSELILHAPTGQIKELKPYAYQIVNGVKKEVPCQFYLDKQTVGFKLGQYNPNLDLIIDPQVVFSSYTGSTADNWGFTATFDGQGNLYGGGIVFEVGYPITVNNIQSTYNKPPGLFAKSCDIGLSVFTPNGSALIYSTYIGGDDYDQPQSMIVNNNNELVIYGTTGSKDFPIPSNGYQTTHKGGGKINLNGYDINNGADIFILKISSNGNNILGGTYLGGNNTDGPNLRIYKNYGDLSRGEVVVDQNDNIYIASSSASADFPITAGVSQTVKGTDQDAVIVKLNPTLTSVIWSTFFGGNNQDAGYSLKVNNNGDVYVCGGTTSTDLAQTAGAFKSGQAGGIDGYIARFDGTNGNLIRTTYLGTSAYDQAFILDHDKFGNIYVLGQTKGNYPVSANVYNNTNGGQFIHKLSSDLSSSLMSTVFGSGNFDINIVPTAFNIDDCLNILLSGWGGLTNQNYPTHNGGSTRNMDITPGAYQTTTDGSDFYFLVLRKNAVSISYASYFGGNSQEHVDGGTSRFSDDGYIYQAVCAGCSRKTFPTTPGAYAENNGSLNCNLGVFKVDFEINLKSIPSIDYNNDVDTNCNTLTVKFSNNSSQANDYYWDFGNGQTSKDKTPTATYNNFGSYRIMLVAIDTICDVTDTAYLDLNHNLGQRPIADFDLDFVKCDITRTITPKNKSRRGANFYIWDFGDGIQSNLKTPSHQYSLPGNYVLKLIVIDTTCGASDTLIKNLEFNYDIPALDVEARAAPCSDGSIDVTFTNDSTWYLYEWTYGDGTVERSKFPQHRFDLTGTYSMFLTVTDTLCNTSFSFNFLEYFLISADRLFIPNAFTPNNDNINEIFEIKGNSCLSNTEFAIYNSFGALVFKTNKPFEEFWDGTINGAPAQQDVYVYTFYSREIKKNGYIVVYY